LSGLVDEYLPLVEAARERKREGLRASERRTI
jgi:hypothetical protein